jgi:hypothetical protein
MNLDLPSDVKAVQLELGAGKSGHDQLQKPLSAQKLAEGLLEC